MQYDRGITANRMQLRQVKSYILYEHQVLILGFGHSNS